MIRDELAGWLARLDEEGHGGERGFFLMLWSGDTPYSIDRIGRGSISGEACCISVLGGIQPARLRGYLVEALQDGPQNDGLFQRLQVLIYPDRTKGWQYVDQLPLTKAIAEAEQLYDRLVNLDVEQPRQYNFDALAQQLFIDWLTDLEHKLRSDELHPALVAHLSKSRSLMPSLALLFELADNESSASSSVSLKHAQQAAAFCDYLEAHARRIYSMIISPQRQGAVEIGRHLANGWKRKEGVFTVRDVYQNDWRGLDTPEKVRPALEILLDASWIRQVETGKHTGRPTEIYAINPRLEGRTQ